MAAIFAFGKPLPGASPFPFFNPYFAFRGGRVARRREKAYAREDRGEKWDTGWNTERKRERQRGGLKRSRRFPDPVYRLLPSFAETIVENLERQCESCLQPPTQRTNNRTAGLFLCGFAFHLLCFAHPLLFSARRRCVLLSFSLLLLFFSILPPSVLFCFCSGWILALKGNEHRIKSHVHVVHYHRSKRK